MVKSVTVALSAPPAIASTKFAAKMPVKAIAVAAANRKPTYPTANAPISSMEPTPIQIAMPALAVAIIFRLPRVRSAKVEHVTIQA